MHEHGQINIESTSEIMLKVLQREKDSNHQRTHARTVLLVGIDRTTTFHVQLLARKTDGGTILIHELGIGFALPKHRPKGTLTVVRLAKLTHGLVQVLCLDRVGHVVEGLVDARLNGVRVRRHEQLGDGPEARSNRIQDDLIVGTNEGRFQRAVARHVLELLIANVAGDGAVRMHPDWIFLASSGLRPGAAFRAQIFALSVKLFRARVVYLSLLRLLGGVWEAGGGAGRGIFVSSRSSTPPAVLLGFSNTASGQAAEDNHQQMTEHGCFCLGPSS